MKFDTTLYLYRIKLLLPSILSRTHMSFDDELPATFSLVVLASQTSKQTSPLHKLVSVLIWFLQITISHVSNSRNDDYRLNCNAVVYLPESVKAVRTLSNSNLISFSLLISSYQVHFEVCNRYQTE